jgi:HK97 family phage portal protein
MGFKKWVIDFLGGQMVDENGTAFDAVVNKRQIANLAYKELSINICINLIANALSQCTCRTYENGVEVKGQDYYVLNVRPNRNENSGTFWHKAVEKMVYDGEALIVNVKGNLYVADSYAVNEYPLLENSYDCVTIGNLTLNKKFRQDEVIILRLNNNNIKKLIDSLYSSYEEMLDLCIEKYRIDNQQKYILELDNVKAGDKMFNDRFKDVLQGQLQDFLDNQNTVLPLFKGQTLTDVSKSGGATSNDFQGLIDNLFKTVAQAFNIPLNLLTAKSDNITRDIKQFLVLTIEPIASMISDELSAKLYDGYEGFKNNNYVKVDTSEISHIDVLELSTAIDKLISSGAFSINELRAITGFNPIDEEFADKHFITKNYALADSMLKKPDVQLEPEPQTEPDVQPEPEPSEPDGQNEGGEEDE